MKKILICDALNPEAFEELKAVSEFDVTLKTGMDEKELVATIPEYHAAVVRSATKISLLTRLSVTPMVPWFLK